MASPVASHTCTVGTLGSNKKLNCSSCNVIEKSFMRFLFSIIILSFSFASTAQQKILYDSSKIEQRNFSSSSLNIYKKNKDFQYENEPVQKQTWWDRFWDWIWNKYDNI